MKHTEAGVMLKKKEKIFPQWVIRTRYNEMAEKITKTATLLQKRANIGLPLSCIKKFLNIQMILKVRSNGKIRIPEEGSSSAPTSVYHKVVGTYSKNYLPNIRNP